MLRILVTFLPFTMAFAQVLTPQALAPQTPDTVIRINVNLVQVDAVVVDSKGKPVTDLKKEDFVILQDGKPQPITNFSFVNAIEGVVRRSTKPAAPPVKGTVAPPPLRRNRDFVLLQLGPASCSAHCRRARPWRSSSAVRSR